VSGSDRERDERFVPALAYRWLTPLYDPLIRLTTRERVFKAGLLEQASVEPRMDVLDLGCGTGTLAIWTKQRVPEARVAGVDGDPEMLERAESKAERAGVELTLSSGMSFELPYADASFDRVLSSLFFHHLIRADKERTLAEVRRVLRPGGELHIADWARPADPLMRVLSRSIMLLDGREQTEDNLRGRLPDLITAAGFSEVEHGRAYRTIYGTLALLQARRPATGSAA